MPYLSTIDRSSACAYNQLHRAPAQDQIESSLLLLQANNAWLLLAVRTLYRADRQSARHRGAHGR